MKPKLLFLWFGLMAGFLIVLIFHAYYSGIQLSIGGFRVHHFLIGIAFLLYGWLQRKFMLSYSFIGFGLILILDDIGDLI